MTEPQQRPDALPTDWEAFYRSYRKPGYVAGYEITSKLGGGMFGLVFKAQKQSIGKDYAIKFLKVDDDEVRQAIAAELDSVKYFAQVDHPNLVSIEDRGEVDGIPYIVMAYAGADTLRDRMNAPEADRDELVRLLLQACRGVQALHERSLVHFDLKPANVFLKGDVARVGDYGLSKLVAHSRNTLSMGRGTPYYMAPEMLQRKGDARSDVYSLGVILFECLTGEVPFKGDSEWEVLRKHENETPRYPAGLAPLYRTVLDRCLQKDPKNRFATVGEMIGALQATGGVVPAPAVAPAGARPESADDSYETLKTAALDAGEKAKKAAAHMYHEAKKATQEAMVEARKAVGEAVGFVERKRLERRAQREMRAQRRQQRRQDRERWWEEHRARRSGGGMALAVLVVVLLVGAVFWSVGGEESSYPSAGVTVITQDVVEAMPAPPAPSPLMPMPPPSMDWVTIAERDTRMAAELLEAKLEVVRVQLETSAAQMAAGRRAIAPRLRYGLPDAGTAGERQRVRRGLEALVAADTEDAVQVLSLAGEGYPAVHEAILMLESEDCESPASVARATRLNSFLQVATGMDAIEVDAAKQAGARRPSAESRRAAAILWRQFVHELLGGDPSRFELYRRVRQNR